ncbi:tetratricopeptide repeat protein [Halorarius halobius]|uniref:tetratricopeptide repeat protein n=1 Tax=Halorarius halobius TaxID=2962671 RepID=UPI0020CCDBD4|nr:tetratricopeptide repeat protein [Halorarius halobius]
MTERDIDPGAVLEQRGEFVAAMLDRAMYPRDLTDALDVSQSTVTRGLRELETVGWVHRTDDGYVATLAGRLAYESYCDHTNALDTVQDAASVFQDLPADLTLSPAVLGDGATVHLADEEGSYALTETLVEHIESASRLRATVPALVDTALIGAWHSVIETGGTVSLIAAERVARRLRESEHETVRALQTSERCRLVTRGSLDRTGVLLIEDGSRTELLVALHTAEGSLAAVIESSTSEAVEWAQRIFEETDDQTVVWSADTEPGVRSEADESTAVDADTDRRVQLAAHSPLRTEGFRVLTEAYFETRSALPPETTLRAGASLVEVADGQTLPREQVADDERRELPAAVRDRLQRGEDCAIVGPPGSGKSTVCMQVAYRWYEANDGPVFYRQSETGIGFESLDRLEAVLRRSTGHTLVVVEDVMRSEASELFTVVEAFADDPTVSFLVDARRNEWISTNDHPDARHAELRHGHFTSVSIPPFDERELERLLTHLGDRLDQPLPSVDEVRDFLPDESEKERTGDMLLLLHHLGTYVDAGDRPSEAASATTTLVEEVKTAYRRLEASDADAAREVGVHVALLLAAGFEITDDLVYALTVHPEGPNRAALNDALDVLDGTMIFSTGEETARTVHDSWGAWFLKAVRDAESDERLHHRFARSANALLGLVDDDERRDALARHCGHKTPHLDRIDDDADSWLEHVLGQLFGIGDRWHDLTALYGRGERTLLMFPDRCSALLEARTFKWRADMLIHSGDFEAAKEALDGLDARISEIADERSAKRLRASHVASRGFIHRRQGEFDAALDCERTALKRYRDIDDRQGEAEAMLGIGLVKWHRDGDVEAATVDLQDALEGFRAVGDRAGEANCMNNLGIMARDRGDIDAAAAWFENGHEIRRDIEAGHHLVDSLINLGVIARDRGNLDRSIARFKQALERAHEFGGSDYTAHSKRALGNTLHRRANEGDLERAKQYLESALELDRESGIRFAEGHCLRGLAAVARKRGNLSTAREFVMAAEAAYEDAGSDRDQALATRERGRIALAAAEYERARTLLQEALQTLEASDRKPGLAETRVDYAQALHELGDTDAAREHISQALEWYRDIGADRYVDEVRDLRVEVEM